MQNDLPPAVTRLLGAPTPETQEGAWSAFLQVHNEVLLRAARAVGPEHDGAMDRYAHVLQELRFDNFRRLRACTEQPPTNFSLWLAVVARRLALDHYRRIYGRGRPLRSGRHSERGARRRLTDLVTSAPDIELLADEGAVSPEDAVSRAEERQALKCALAELPPRDRLLLRFRFNEECSASEIARLMKLPTVFHVYRRLNKVLAILRHRLKQHGIDST